MLLKATGSLRKPTCQLYFACLENSAPTHTGASRKATNVADDAGQGSWIQDLITLSMDCNAAALGVATERLANEVLA